MWDLAAGLTNSSLQSSCCPYTYPRPGSCALCNSTTTVDGTVLCCSNCEQLTAVTPNRTGVCRGADLIADVPIARDTHSDVDARQLSMTGRVINRGLEKRASTCTTAGTCVWLRNAVSNNCLQAPNSATSGVTLQEAPCSTTDESILWLILYKSAYWGFQSVVTNQCIDNADLMSPGLATLMTCSGTSQTQQWRSLYVYLENDNQLFQFANRKSGLCLDQSQASNGRLLSTANCYSASNGGSIYGQKWGFVSPTNVRCLSSCADVTAHCNLACSGASYSSSCTWTGSRSTYSCTCSKFYGGNRACCVP